jgi:hypothetical protein
MARNKTTSTGPRKSVPPRSDGGGNSAPAKGARRSVPPAGAAIQAAGSSALVKAEEAAPTATPKAKRAKAAAATNGRESKAPTAAWPSHEAVAARAYELYVEGGCQDGHAEDHWYQAERELRAAN